MSANAFPFWEMRPIDGCIEFFYSRLQPLIQLASTANKKIMIGETGWASSGVNPFAAIASPENAAVANIYTIESCVLFLIHLFVDRSGSTTFMSL